MAWYGGRGPTAPNGHKDNTDKISTAIVIRTAVDTVCGHRTKLLQGERAAEPRKKLANFPHTSYGGTSDVSVQRGVQRTTTIREESLPKRPASFECPLHKSPQPHLSREGLARGEPCLCHHADVICRPPEKSGKHTRELTHAQKSLHLIAAEKTLKKRMPNPFGAGKPSSPVCPICRAAAPVYAVKHPTHG